MRKGAVMKHCWKIKILIFLQENEQVRFGVFSVHIMFNFV